MCALFFLFVFWQHSASVARVPAAAGPPGEEEPIPTFRVLRQAEYLRQHEHLLGQQHTCECMSPFHDLVGQSPGLQGFGSKKEILGCEQVVYDRPTSCLFAMHEPMVRVLSSQNKDMIHKCTVNLIKSERIDCV